MSKPERSSGPDPERSVDPCERFEDWIIAYRGQDLPARLREHVSTCAGCAEVLATIEQAQLVGASLAERRPSAATKASILNELQQLVARESRGAEGAGGLSGPVPLGAFGDAMSNAADQPEPTEQRAHSRRRLALAGLAAAVVVLVLGVLCIGSSGSRDGESRTVAQQPQPPEVIPPLEDLTEIRKQESISEGDLARTRPAFRSPLVRVRAAAFRVFLEAKVTPPLEAIHDALTFRPEETSMGYETAAVGADPASTRAEQLRSEWGLVSTWAVHSIWYSIRRGEKHDWDPTRLESLIPNHPRMTTRASVVRILKHIPGYEPSPGLLRALRSESPYVKTVAGDWLE